MADPTAPERLHMVIRTPSGPVFDGLVTGARVPTPSGSAGIRPRGESMILAVEAGLVLLHGDGGPSVAATVGGLLRSDRTRATLYTPVAAVGASEEAMLAALDDLFDVGRAELEARQRIGELERRIVTELRRRHAPSGPRRGS